MAAVSARREVMCGYVVLCLLLWLLCQLEENKRVCSYYGSSRVNSKTTDDTNRMKSNTTSLPPSTSSHPSELSQTTGFQLPASYSKFPLFTCFTHGDVYVSRLLSLIIPPSPFYKSVLYVCASIAALQIGGSVLFFQIPYLLCFSPGPSPWQHPSSST